MFEIEFTFKNQSDFAFIRSCVNELVEVTLSPNHVLMQIALNEAVNNAITYSRQKRKGAPVTLKLRNDGKKLVIRIKDRGKGFAANERLKELTEGSACLGEGELWKDCGRGLFIMQSVSDVVKYNREGNEVILVKRLPCEKSRLAAREVAHSKERSSIS
ncbi:ATP-binding protein [Aneurinibacillus tyrosinisolvens]|uniref:ATP-binding protein n=1 Tax=Aneurinibacillus tyrosinisolvens TaxID=1443435 RepID=UPI000699CFBE|nr:ATP-binding protein [Aneurinibacillus tyrosinisolvens]